MSQWHTSQRIQNVSKTWKSYEKEAHTVKQTFKRLNYLKLEYNNCPYLLIIRNCYMYLPLLQTDQIRHDLFFQKDQNGLSIYLDSRFQLSLLMDTKWTWLTYCLLVNGHCLETEKGNNIGVLYADIVANAILNQVSVVEIKTKQSQNNCSADVNIDDSWIWLKQNEVWVPDESSHLKLRILESGLCGECAHRGHEDTWE